MNDSRQTPIQHSRALYYQLWRIWTPYDWRKANRDSRRRHLAERRAYDRRRYLARILPALYDEALRMDEHFTKMGWQ